MSGEDIKSLINAVPVNPTFKSAYYFNITPVHRVLVTNRAGTDEKVVTAIDCGLISRISQALVNFADDEKIVHTILQIYNVIFTSVSKSFDAVLIEKLIEQNMFDSVFQLINKSSDLSDEIVKVIYDIILPTIDQMSNIDKYYKNKNQLVLSLTNFISMYYNNELLGTKLSNCLILVSQLPGLAESVRVQAANKLIMLLSAAELAKNNSYESTMFITNLLQSLKNFQGSMKLNDENQTRLAQLFVTYGNRPQIKQLVSDCLLASIDLDYHVDQIIKALQNPGSQKTDIFKHLQYISFSTKSINTIIDAKAIPFIVELLNKTEDKKSKAELLNFLSNTLFDKKTLTYLSSSSVLTTVEEIIKSKDKQLFIPAFNFLVTLMADSAVAESLLSNESFSNVLNGLLDDNKPEVLKELTRFYNAISTTPMLADVVVDQGYEKLLEKAIKSGDCEIIQNTLEILSNLSKNIAYPLTKSYGPLLDEIANSKSLTSEATTHLINVILNKNTMFCCHKENLKACENLGLNPDTLLSKASVIMLGLTLLNNGKVPDNLQHELDVYMKDNITEIPDSYFQETIKSLDTAQKLDNKVTNMIPILVASPLGQRYITQAPDRADKIYKQAVNELKQPSTNSILRIKSILKAYASLAQVLEPNEILKKLINFASEMHGSSLSRCLSSQKTDSINLNDYFILVLQQTKSNDQAKLAELADVLYNALMDGGDYAELVCIYGNTINSVILLHGKALVDQFAKLNLGSLLLLTLKKYSLMANVQHVFLPLLSNYVANADEASKKSLLGNNLESVLKVVRMNCRSKDSLDKIITKTLQACIPSENINEKIKLMIESIDITLNSKFQFNSVYEALSDLLALSDQSAARKSILRAGICDLFSRLIFNQSFVDLSPVQNLQLIDIIVRLLTKIVTDSVCHKNINKLDLSIEVYKSLELAYSKYINPTFPASLKEQLLDIIYYHLLILSTILDKDIMAQLASSDPRRVSQTLISSVKLISDTSKNSNMKSIEIMLKFIDLIPVGKAEIVELAATTLKHLVLNNPDFNVSSIMEYAEKLLADKDTHDIFNKYISMSSLVGHLNDTKNEAIVNNILQLSHAFCALDDNVSSNNLVKMINTFVSVVDNLSNREVNNSLINVINDFVFKCDDLDKPEIVAAIQNVLQHLVNNETSITGYNQFIDVLSRIIPKDPVEVLIEQLRNVSSSAETMAIIIKLTNLLCSDKMTQEEKESLFVKICDLLCSHATREDFTFNDAVVVIRSLNLLSHAIKRSDNSANVIIIDTIERNLLESMGNLFSQCNLLNLTKESVLFLSESIDFLNSYLNYLSPDSINSKATAKIADVALKIQVSDDSSLDSLRVLSLVFLSNLISVSKSAQTLIASFNTQANSLATSDADKYCKNALVNIIMKQCLLASKNIDFIKKTCTNFANLSSLDAEKVKQHNLTMISALNLIQVALSVNSSKKDVAEIITELESMLFELAHDHPITTIKVHQILSLNNDDGKYDDYIDETLEALNEHIENNLVSSSDLSIIMSQIIDCAVSSSTIVKNQKFNMLSRNILGNKKLQFDIDAACDIILKGDVTPEALLFTCNHLMPAIIKNSQAVTNPQIKNKVIDLIDKLTEDSESVKLLATVKNLNNFLDSSLNTTDEADQLNLRIKRAQDKINHQNFEALSLIAIYNEVKKIRENPNAVMSVVDNHDLSILVSTVEENLMELLQNKSVTDSKIVEEICAGFKTIKLLGDYSANKVFLLSLDMEELIRLSMKTDNLQIQYEVLTCIKCLLTNIVEFVDQLTFSSVTLEALASALSFARTLQKTPDQQYIITECLETMLLLVKAKMSTKSRSTLKELLLFIKSSVNDPSSINHLKTVFTIMKFLVIEQNFEIYEQHDLFNSIKTICNTSNNLDLVTTVASFLAALSAHPDCKLLIARYKIVSTIINYVSQVSKNKDQASFANLADILTSIGSIVRRNIEIAEDFLSSPGPELVKTILENNYSSTKDESMALVTSGFYLICNITYKNDHAKEVFAEMNVTSIALNCVNIHSGGMTDKSADLVCTALKAIINLALHPKNAHNFLNHEFGSTLAKALNIENTIPVHLSAIRAAVNIAFDGNDSCRRELLKCIPNTSILIEHYFKKTEYILCSHVLELLVLLGDYPEVQSHSIAALRLISQQYKLFDQPILMFNILSLINKTAGFEHNKPLLAEFNVTTIIIQILNNANSMDLTCNAFNALRSLISEPSIYETFIKNNGLEIILRTMTTNNTTVVIIIGSKVLAICLNNEAAKNIPENEPTIDENGIIRRSGLPIHRRLGISRETLIDYLTMLVSRISFNKFSRTTITLSLEIINFIISEKSDDTKNFIFESGFIVTAADTFSQLNERQLVKQCVNIINNNIIVSDLSFVDSEPTIRESLKKLQKCVSSLTIHFRAEKKFIDNVINSILKNDLSSPSALENNKKLQTLEDTIADHDLKGENDIHGTYNIPEELKSYLRNGSTFTMYTHDNPKGAKASWKFSLDLYNFILTLPNEKPIEYSVAQLTLINSGIVSEVLELAKNANKFSLNSSSTFYLRFTKGEVNGSFKNSTERNEFLKAMATVKESILTG